MKRITFRVFTTIVLGALYLCSHVAFAADTSAATKVACIGDSITFGHGIKDRNKNSFPAQLGAMLGEEYTVSNFGVSGSTLLKKGNKPYWNLEQFKTAQDFQPNIVIIKLGTNDTKPGNWKHRSEFKSNYIEMVKTFQGLESKPAVWICYPVPVFPERWGIRDKVVREEVIPLVDEVAEETGAKVINLYKPLEGRVELVPDKVHPNSEGATLIAQTILKAITGKRDKDPGGQIQVIHKAGVGHHPHSLKDPKPTDDFILKHAQQLLENNQRILFLGDSITQAGNYVANFDAWLVKKFPNQRFTVINGGLNSETVSGLSEENHAGGKFPRPCLFERLERVLAKTKPDIIIACYGMNCGIYKELDEERYARYRYGILRLRAAARQYGAEVVHVTPPIFDYRGKGGFDYDSVLTTYAEWLVKQREQGWYVVDLHTEMRAKVDQIREQDPEFTVQKDRVHPNDDGHWMMAQSLIAFFGDPASAQMTAANELLDSSRLNAITQRMQRYQKALHAETNPLRPGVPKGGTLESAAAEAKDLEKQIYAEN